MTGYNPKLDLVNINPHAKFGQILSTSSQDIDGNENSEFCQGPWKMMCYNPNQDLVNINAYTKFGQILSLCSQDIEWKPNHEGWNDGITVWRTEWRTTQNQYNPTFSKRGKN